jgi:site-specific recombinase XerD
MGTCKPNDINPTTTRNQLILCKKAGNGISNYIRMTPYDSYTVGKVDTNEAIFQRYQQEKNMGKTKSTKLMDKQVIGILEKYVQKNFYEITKHDLVDFFGAMESGKIESRYGKPYGKYTIEQYKTQMKKFFKWLYCWEEGESIPEQVKWIQTNLRKAYKHKTRKDILTLEEVEILINTATSVRDKTIIAVLFDSSARLSEFIDLTMGDVINNNGRFSVIITDVEGHKTREREVPLNMSVDFLMAYLKTHPFKDDKSKPLWINQYGDSLGKSGVQQLINKIVKNSTIQKRVSPHILRHSRLTYLAERGMNESIMRKFAGWSNDSNMPSVYLHLGDKQVKKVIYEIDDIGNPIETEVETRVELLMEKKENEISRIKEELVAMKYDMAYFNRALNSGMAKAMRKYVPNASVQDIVRDYQKLEMGIAKSIEQKERTCNEPDELEKFCEFMLQGLR